jgi:hypothetical protein
MGALKKRYVYHDTLEQDRGLHTFFLTHPLLEEQAGMKEWPAQAILFIGNGVLGFIKTRFHFFFSGTASISNEYALSRALAPACDPL